MKTAIVSVLIALTIWVTAPLAAAGGNWIEFEDVYNVPGSEVTIKGSFSTRNEVKDRARAPYFVYMEHVAGPQYGWEGPDVSDPDVYRVGEVEVLWPSDGHEFNDGLPNNPHLTATFELPAVPLGRYLMSICDIDCDYSPGGRWGNVDTTGFFWVVESQAEADARERADELKQRLQVAKYEEAREDRKADKAFAAELDEQARRKDRARSDLAAAQRRLRTVAEQASSSRLQRDLALVGLSVIAILAGLLLTGVASRSRRRALGLDPSAPEVAGSGSALPAAASGESSSDRRWRPWSPASTRRPAPPPSRPGSNPRTTEPPPERSRERRSPDRRLP